MNPSTPSSTTHDDASGAKRHVVDVEQMTRAEFRERHPFLFLIRWSSIIQCVRRSLLEVGTDPYLNALRARRRIDAQAVRPVDDSGIATIGRAPECAIYVDDLSASKLHAWLQVVDGELRLFDAHSRNGTWIEKVGVQPDGGGIVVQLGVTVRFGHAEYLLLDADAYWDLVRLF